ncbi:PREDICTED: LOW QUALITY PROTEIN: uncharacterized protein LOC109127451 [Camelina sativa]|uniref:LOW QUALITY PROTEIN: uncharacterized protein LOC109127451 n=1 Tax=Camelina sativa TaxID=90675 RepID=A0ABM1QLP4_CAMSA|nr:PREDICTED: LOW QUALITY PROTEIN: uncharacterized protein LOC109127451 [Camelina sativa]
MVLTASTRRRTSVGFWLDREDNGVCERASMGKIGGGKSRVGNALAKRCGTHEYCVAFVCGLKSKPFVGIFVRLI